MGPPLPFLPISYKKPSLAHQSYQAVKETTSCSPEDDIEILMTSIVVTRVYKPAPQMYQMSHATNGEHNSDSTGLQRNRQGW